eukprot:COSAG01_NODE_43221_length_432_cov_0.546547_2_plen_49_part_01
MSSISRCQPTTFGSPLVRHIWNAAHVFNDPETSEIYTGEEPLSLQDALP